MSDQRAMEARATVVPGHSLPVALAMLVITAVASPEALQGRRAEVEYRVVAGLERMDAALRRSDAGAAVRAWHEGCGLAVRSRQWSRRVACGEAALRLAETSAVGEAWPRMKARELFLGALFRARAAGSVDGVLAATNGFARLGDREVVEHGLRLARAMRAKQQGRQLRRQGGHA